MAHVLLAGHDAHAGLLGVEAGGGGGVGHEVGGDAPGLGRVLLAHAAVGAAGPLVLGPAPGDDHRHRLQRLGVGRRGEDEVPGADDAAGEHVGVPLEDVVHHRPADRDPADEDPVRVDGVVGRDAGDQVEDQRRVGVRSRHLRGAHGVPRPPHEAVLVADRGDDDPPVVGQLVELRLLEEGGLLLHGAGHRDEQRAGARSPRPRGAAGGTSGAGRPTRSPRGPRRPARPRRSRPGSRPGRRWARPSPPHLRRRRPPASVSSVASPSPSSTAGGGGRAVGLARGRPAVTGVVVAAGPGDQDEEAHHAVARRRAGATGDRPSGRQPTPWL